MVKAHASIKLPSGMTFLCYQYNTVDIKIVKMPGFMM